MLFVVKIEKKKWNLKLLRSMGPWSLLISKIKAKSAGKPKSRCLETKKKQKVWDGFQCKTIAWDLSIRKFASLIAFDHIKMKYLM